jgi:hypothetical protein
MPFPSGCVELRDKTTLLFCAILFPTLLPGMRHGLWRPGEPQVAGVCAEMAYTQGFVVARLNGKSFLRKPPLRYALGVTLGSDRRPPLKKPMRSLRQHRQLALPMCKQLC